MSAVKRIIHPSGSMRSFGRNMPNLNRHRTFLARYLDLSRLPAIPLEFDLAPPSAEAGLSRVYLNDRLGDCTCAGVFHLAGLFLAAAGRPMLWSDAMVQAFYGLTCGYVPGDSATDNGGDEVTVLNYWRDHGIDGKGLHRIAGHLSVDATNQAEIRAAVFLFLNLYFGVSLPDAWVNNMPTKDGFVWDVAGDPNPANGHCFVTPAGVTKDGVAIDSWGLRGILTWKAIAKYAVVSAGGELHTVLSLDSINSASAKAPNGFNRTQLVSDFNLIGGSLKLAA